MRSTIKDKKIIAELKSLSKKHKGILSPETVVDAARNPKSALHSKFEWDDSEAAHQYRLWQARNLLRVVVEIVDDGKDKTPVNVFVSLTPDRNGATGGYRQVVDVVSDEALYETMLSDAVSELETFQKKYQRIKELFGVFSEIEKLQSVPRKKAA